MLDGQTLMAALCLMMVLEGLGPLLFPTRWQKFMREIVSKDAASIRRLAMISVFLGCLSLLLLG